MEEEIAYHEAGHAFTALHLGGQVQYVTIAPDRDDGPRRDGEAQVAWRTSRMTPKEFHNKRVLVALGGPAAEMIYRGEQLHPGYIAEWSADWAEAWDAAATIHAEERLRLAFLEQAAAQLYQLLKRDDYWAAIAALADSLLAHETLEAEEIRDVLGFWLR
jgi:ATP-dependent Zn protease